MDTEDLLYRAFRDYREHTEHDRDCERRRRALTRAGGNDALEIIETECEIENDWLEAAEEGLEYIGRAIGEERQFIRSNGEVVPIEKVKSVSRESAEHLSRHGEFITRRQGEDIVPDKLYTVERLNDMAATHDYAFSFLQEIPLGDYHRLEGYLFPDTYEFYMGEDPKTVINKMLVNFDRRFTDEMRSEVQENGYTVRDIVIIASMIERETDGSDRATIASVIYNRLNNPNAGTQGYLQIDATLVYALGRTITSEDYTADTPYNTYTNKGLPPGPISNPGLASIQAAMDPENTNYYYYALGSDGTHSFFQTLEAQQNFIAQQRGN